ncbi:uncharacterized protein MONBRDRAFT_12032 [Monosiga brevicollis MX1]|uniref:U3 small nucleolar ribonucleoprotein protein MPP10 n=1 Tax=Monosiga brevicollis TaxID=81824 RepID=A9VB08_MONBE|nr:uncharacterized protein MONBRDRAFT_12032 [Monosiga brevicollis MX1]EDQ85309.1 predicted protein [Monosiga brevicollis MX1]|eukprot:XP_001749930.1 hypothetical protein [Monosiga brevicollis MX1]
MVNPDAADEDSDDLDAEDADEDLEDEDLEDEADLEDDAEVSGEEDQDQGTDEDEADEPELASDDEGDAAEQADAQQMTERSKTSRKPLSRGAALLNDEVFDLDEMNAFLLAAERQAEGAPKRRSRKSADDDDDEDEEEDDDEVDLFAADDDEDEDEEDADADNVTGLLGRDYFKPPSADAPAKSKRAQATVASEESVESDPEAHEDEDQGADEDMAEEEDAVYAEEEFSDQERDAVDDEEDDASTGAADLLADSDDEEQANQEESRARVRPENSLLEEDLDFEHATAPAPEITQESTANLEDVIKKRIAEGLFDDVEPKTEGLDQMKERRHLVELDSEKSKQGLADVYADEFQQAATGRDTKKEALESKHAEIERLFQSLDRKLTALTNFHYTPAQPEEEVTVLSTAPALAMEDVTPVAFSSAQRLAPEELHAAERPEQVADGERTDTDRARARRKKKSVKHYERLDREQKDRLKDQNKVAESTTSAKKRAMTKLKQASTSGRSNTTFVDGQGASKAKLTSSTTFFRELQATAKREAQALMGQASGGAQMPTAKRSKKKGGDTAKFRL